MLEVQLVQRSRHGVVIPVARSDTPALVQDVADRILTEMDGWSFADEVLNSLARRERVTLKAILQEEGLANADSNGSA